jgi:hypothetical protein
LHSEEEQLEHNSDIKEAQKKDETTGENLKNLHPKFSNLAQLDERRSFTENDAAEAKVGQSSRVGE